MMWGNAGRFKRRRSVAWKPDDSGSDTSEATASCTLESEESDVTDESDGTAPATLDEETILQNTLSITRRSYTFGALSSPVSSSVNSNIQHNWQNVRDISEIQKLVRLHTKDLVSTYPVAVWRVLGSVLDQSKVTQSKVLQAVSELLSPVDRKVWPKTREVIDMKLLKFGSVSSRWTRTVRIDLSHLPLRGLREPIIFMFKDPVVTWVSCAERLSKNHQLFFQYRARLHPETGEKLYGSSVQNGKIMLEACRQIPRK